MKLPPPPRLSGRTLRTIVRATDSGALRKLVGRLVQDDLGIPAALGLPASARGPLPLHCRPMQARAMHPRASAELGVPQVERRHAPTAATLRAAYEAGDLTPLDAASRAIAASHRFAAESPTMGPMLYVDEDRALHDAEAAGRRIREGRARSRLEGVIVPVKEEVDLEGQGARLGMRDAGATDTKDATVVARLRAAGAIVLGHTVMTEYGMSPLGVNVQRAMPRNAIDAGHVAGGSSTGSAVAVALGLAPVALGSDGGGSIRIPASWNGLFGIKPTFGRVSRFGDGFGGTVAHVGPIGASTRDLALFLEVVSGEDPGDVLTTGNPGFVPGWLDGAIGRGVKGLKIGVLEEEIAAAGTPMQRAIETALRTLEQDGAELVRVSLSHARHAPAIGYLTIGLEAYAALSELREQRFDSLGADVQLLCRVMSTMGSSDYLEAQCLRAGLRRDVAALLREVDVLAMPTTVGPAPAIAHAEMRDGMSDTVALAGACRFAFLGNLTGLPAGTAPIGRDARGMPMGLQLLADAWDEATVLQVLGHLERRGVAEVPRPRLDAALLG
jgi:aspartyl-tRNA(Asn)/glutamyl-tRNA(Gln) amidotransferase subunit A